MAVALSIVLALLIPVITIQGWLVVNLLGRQRRVHGRVDVVAERAARSRAVPTSTTDGAETLAPNGEDPAVTAPILVPAPDFALPSLAGVPTSLADLRSRGKPIILGFTDPRCGPCYELLPDIAGWQRVYADELTVALISGGPPEHNRAMTAEYGIDPRTILLQTERDLAVAYRIDMAPAAVLIRTDGTAEPAVFGSGRVRQLVADTLGLRLPPEPDWLIDAVGLGHRVPPLRRPDLDGDPIDLGSPGETTLLVFWSPGCTHCQDLLPAMRAWDADPAGPRLIVVTAGPVALNREAGLRAPMIADDDHSLKGTFGVRGTPAAVVIDAMGFVASDVARGATGVRALVSERFTSARRAVE